MNDKPPLIGVLGGMGPLATVDFLHKVVTTTTATCDQDHVPMVVWNVPQIPDRQKALAGIGESPLEAMQAGIKKLNAAGATRIAIPCNTAHLWAHEFTKVSTAPLIHIVDTAIAAIRKRCAQGECVGIVATQGTIAAGLYQERLADTGVPCLVNTNEEMATLFTPGCYAIKQNQLNLGSSLLEAAAQQLVRRGARSLILACTEVPVALSHVHSSLLDISVDATQALAEACVNYWVEAKHSI